MSDDYNNAPEGLKEIPLEDWTNGMFTYCIKPCESRQVRNQIFCDLRMFDVPNFEDKKLGYAIMRDWYNNVTKQNRPEVIVRFCRYGNDADWLKFEHKFAAQFAGDNS